MAMENMKNSEQTARKKSKGTAAPCGQTTIVESNQTENDSDLPRNVKKKKTKHLMKEMGLELQHSKGKKRNGCEFKKKTHASSPVLIENNLNSELSKETKKRSKEVKKKNPKLSGKPDRDGGVPRDVTAFPVNEKHHRNIPDVERHEEDLTLKRKMRKKEKRENKPSHLLILTSGGDEEPKKQNTGKQKVMFPSGKKRQNLDQDDVGESVLVKKKKSDCYKSFQGNSNGILGKGVTGSVWTLQGTQDCVGHTRGKEVLTCESGKGSEAIKKKENKKRKKANAVSLLPLADSQECHSNTLNVEDLKPQSNKKLVSKEVTNAAKKKKKKEAERSRRLYFSEHGQNAPSATEASARKGKKKGEKTEAGQEGRGREDHVRCENSSGQQVKKKRKMGEIGSFPAREGEPNVNKGKKSEPKETEDEVKLVAFRKGNCDEVNIDKVRRQALQDDIDRESGKVTILTEESDHHYGQWSTAAFETSEQKAKFLRLLGGFKKGSASAQRSPANDPRPNMALDQSRERKLQSALQVDFEKAVAFKQRRGLGLGFQSVTPSRIHIDKNASKSIKFED